jgi:hypothetical protein
MLPQEQGRFIGALRSAAKIDAPRQHANQFCKLINDGVPDLGCSDMTDLGE